MDDNVLKKLQSVEIEILEIVHKICVENNIKYYLIAGSLLGAVRHKGFIPWDDDIDIAMPRNDYHRFQKLCHEGILGDKYTLQDISTYSKYHLPFAKVRKNNTLFDEPAFEKLDCHKGIYIDIFPLDYSKRNDGLLHRCKARFLPAWSWVIYMRVLNFKMSFLHQMLYYISKPLSIKKMALIRDKMASSCKSGNYYTYWGSGWTYPIDWFDEPILLDFEGRKFYAPKQSHLVLTRIYGDYMKLPPESERRNHNPMKIVFDTRKEK